MYIGKNAAESQGECTHSHKNEEEEQSIKLCPSSDFLAIETRLAVMISYGLLRFPAQWLFQLLGTPAARLPL